MPGRDARRRPSDCAPATHDNKISAALRSLLARSTAYGTPTEASLIRAMTQQIASARAVAIPWRDIAESFSSILHEHRLKGISTDTLRGVAGRMLQEAALKPSRSRNRAEHVTETPSRPKSVEESFVTPVSHRNSKLDELLRGAEPRLRIQRE